MALAKSGTKAFRIMHISPNRIGSLMFIVVEGSSKRRGSRYDSMLGPEISSYGSENLLYKFDDDEGRRAFFFLDDPS